MSGRGRGNPRPGGPRSGKTLDRARLWITESAHHRVDIMLDDLAGRRLPDIAETLDPAQGFVEIFYAVRHAHQPGMDRQVEHLAALAMHELEGLADPGAIARRRNAPH